MAHPKPIARPEPVTDACNDAAMTERIDPDAAAATMRAAGLEPLDPFDEADKPWRCRCLACGRVVTPRFSSIGAGDSCKYCATKGLDLNAPAVIFVLTHPEEVDPQVGFDSVAGEAITQQEKGGWSVFKAANVPTVEDAYEIRAAVLRWLGSEPGGHDADAVWSTVSSELSRRRRRRRAAGGARGSR